MTKNVTIYILAILFAIGLLVLTAQSLSAISCPQGTRPTGGGGCKIEPTGCYLDEQTPLEECKGI